MAVSQYFRNEHTALETGKRAKAPARSCIGCGTGITAAGGKKRCGACYDRIYEQRKAARHERERKAKLAAARPARHSWGLPTRFPQKTERQCLNCSLVKVTQHRVDEHGRDICWTEWYRGLDRIEGGSTPACEAVSVEGRAVA